MISKIGLLLVIISPRGIVHNFCTACLNNRNSCILLRPLFLGWRFRKSKYYFKDLRKYSCSFTHTGWLRTKGKYFGRSGSGNISFNTKMCLILNCHRNIAVWINRPNSVRLLFLEIKNQLDVIYYFIVLLIGSTCFGHYYDHHQELATMMLITTLVVPFLVCCRLKVRCG